MFNIVTGFLLALDGNIGPGTPHFFDQSTEQNQQVFLRIADDLEVVARWMSIAKLESVERDSGAPESLAQCERPRWVGAKGGDQGRNDRGTGCVDRVHPHGVVGAGTERDRVHRHPPVGHR